ncbi:MAG: RNA pyrophosphohydrolase [Alphaproteobacteria bacterium]
MSHATPTQDCDTDPSYRPCVGIMLLNPSDSVFVGRRIDLPGDHWQMPQGGIDPGETPLTAAVRELREETGTDKAELLAEFPEWVRYDLPPAFRGGAWGGRYIGQTQRWFAMRFTGRDSDIDLQTEHPEFVAWKWVPMDTVTELVVDFKRASYGRVVAAFRHLVRPRP